MIIVMCIFLSFHTGHANDSYHSGDRMQRPD
jgi:hypothetical protein